MIRDWFVKHKIDYIANVAPDFCYFSPLSIKTNGEILTLSHVYIWISGSHVFIYWMSV